MMDNLREQLNKVLSDLGVDPTNSEQMSDFVNFLYQDQLPDEETVRRKTRALKFFLDSNTEER